jgi:hypothetical protein
MATDEAQLLLDECFGADREREVKHARLSKTQRGRKQLLTFFEKLDPRSRKACFYGVHKEYVLLAYLIDFWLEPLAHRDGFNLYERGANIALTNVSYITLGATLGVEGRRELLRRFQVMQRDRTEFAYASFWDFLYEAVNKHRLIEDVLVGLIVAERELGWKHLQELPTDLLDLGEYGLLETVGFWRFQYPGAQLTLIHDTSKMIQRNRKKWEAVLDPTNPSATVGQDRRTIEFPLPVRGLHLAESQNHPQLQIADLVAGGAAALMSARARVKMTPYSEGLMRLGLLEAIAGGVWPSAMISPEELETEGPVLGDAADFIAELIHQHAETSR